MALETHLLTTPVLVVAVVVPNVLGVKSLGCVSSDLEANLTLFLGKESMC